MPPKTDSGDGPDFPSPWQRPSGSWSRSWSWETVPSESSTHASGLPERGRAGLGVGPGVGRAEGNRGRVSDARGAGLAPFDGLHPAIEHRVPSTREMLSSFLSCGAQPKPTPPREGMLDKKEVDLPQ